MTTVMVALARDEADVVEGWVRHHAEEVDHILIADNLSTDGTRDILDQLVTEGLPLTVVDDPEPAYRQSSKVSALAERAAMEHGATWVVPADLDELWFARAGRLREILPGLPYPVASALLTNHFRTALDVDDPDPFRSMVWRQAEPQKLVKVAFRWQPSTIVWQGNHGVTLPSGEPGGLAVLEVRHFPIRSADHMIRKARNGAAAYAAAPDLPADYGRHWRAWGQILDTYGEDGIYRAFGEHWHYLSPVDAGLVRDAAPYRRWETL